MEQGHRALGAAAAELLRACDLDGVTAPSTALYRHQWSWDTAFVAIGYAHIDPARGLRELRALLDAQWSDGRVPHIVYDASRPSHGDYADSAQWWVAHRSREGKAVHTSGLIQPPVHAIAAEALLERAEETGDDPLCQAVLGLCPALRRWHDYLHGKRDPDGTGLVTIYHPWESGWDNSPRWDAPLAAVDGAAAPRYARRDVAFTGDARQRPTDADYDRYMALMAALRAAAYSDERLRRTHPFRVRDVTASAVLSAANEALARLLDRLGDDAEAGRARERAALGREGLRAATDVASGWCLDLDLVSGRPVGTCTAAVFAPLIAGGSGQTAAEQVDLLDSDRFCGFEGLRWPVPPSVSPRDPAFEPRGYWRGPVWPNVVWLIEWALRRAGHDDRARTLRRAALEQVEAAGFAEYVEPFTGEPLGSPEQAWTAAVVLDWLAVDGD